VRGVTTGEEGDCGIGFGVLRGGANPGVLGGAVRLGGGGVRKGMGWACTKSGGLEWVGGSWR
jgi:hypothetical protein